VQLIYFDKNQKLKVGVSLGVNDLSFGEINLQKKSSPWAACKTYI